MNDGIGTWALLRHRSANFICLNQGKGRFGNDCIAFSHESATTITPADFNHDGIIDLAVPHRDGGQSYVYMNDVVYFGSAPDGARRR